MTGFRVRPWLLVWCAVISGAALAYAQDSDNTNQIRKSPSAASEKADGQSFAQSSPPTSGEGGSAVIVPAGEAPRTATESEQNEDTAQQDQSAAESGRNEDAVKDEANALSVGLGLGLVNQPAESSLESDASPIELYADYSLGPWLEFRAGYNQVGSKLGNTTLDSITLYIGYRKTKEFFQSVEAFALVGLAQISSTLTLGTGESREDSGLGTVFAGGAAYRFGSLLLGGQLIIFSRSGDFGGIGIATGSNQLQLTAAYALY